STIVAEKAHGRRSRAAARRRAGAGLRAEPGDTAGRNVRDGHRPRREDRAVPDRHPQDSARVLQGTMSFLRQRWPEIGAFAGAIGMLAYGHIAQLPNYHDFADARTLLGVPRAMDVLSNAGFLVVGIWGVVILMRSRAAFGTSWPGYMLFSVAVAATA